MRYVIKWREQDETGWWVRKRRHVDGADAVKAWIQQLWVAGIYEHAVERFRIPLP